VAHLIGSRRYSCEFQTHCDARNNLWLALATLGEGWHNNHHCYMRSSKHGFYAGEVDVTYAILRGLAGLGLVWDLEMPPLREVRPLALPLIRKVRSNVQRPDVWREARQPLLSEAAVWIHSNWSSPWAGLACMMAIGRFF
jgi:hypothetical protein